MIQSLTTSSFLSLKPELQLHLAFMRVFLEKTADISCKPKLAGHPCESRTTAAMVAARFPGIFNQSTLVPNQFFVVLCLWCPQDQTTAVQCYRAQNISTNSHFLPHKGKETTLTTMQFSASLLHIQSVIGLSFWTKTAIKSFQMSVNPVLLLRHRAINKSTYKNIL